MNSQSKKILVIDDEADIREIAQLSLQVMMGWHVTTAASGAVGLEKAIAQLPDLILLDVMMPDMDGPTTRRALLNHPLTCSIPVIFLTAKVHNYHDYADLNLAAVLCKPFDPTLLGGQIIKALGWPVVQVMPSYPQSQAC